MTLLDDITAARPIGSIGSTLAFAEAAAPVGAPPNTPVVATGGTIPATAAMYRFTCSTSTGVLVQAGQRHGQMLMLVNMSAASMTFASAATSLVADGANVVVGANRAVQLQWSAVDSLWTADVTPAAPVVSTMTVSTADGLTVGGVIVPQGIEATITCLANAACVDQAFFIANRAYQVTAVREIHATAGTDGSAVSLQVVKDTGTDAPGAGTDLLTNNANVGFDLKGTANTVQTGTLTATAASLQLAAGNRLSLDFAGTVTTLAGVVVTVSLKPI